MSDHLAEQSAQVTRIFDYVCRDAVDGVVNVTCFFNGMRSPPSTRGFPIIDRGEAEQYAADCGARWNTYLETCLQPEAPAPGKRGQGATASFLAVLTADLDTLEGDHKEPLLPPDGSFLPDLLQRAQMPDPTMTVSTGGGLLVVWALEEPLVITDDASREAATRLSTGFQGHLRAVALKEFGWKFDSTKDLVRLLRIPGTLNHKYKPARPVSVLT